MPHLGAGLEHSVFSVARPTNLLRMRAILLPRLISGIVVAAAGRVERHMRKMGCARQEMGRNRRRQDEEDETGEGADEYGRIL